MKRKSKYNATRVKIDGIDFDSKAEGRYYQELKYRESAGEVSRIECHPEYPIYVKGEKICTVELDFRFLDNKEKRQRVVDVKGVDTGISRLKRKLVQAEYQVKVEVVRVK